MNNVISDYLFYGSKICFTVYKFANEMRDGHKTIRPYYWISVALDVRGATLTRARPRVYRDRPIENSRSLIKPAKENFKEHVSLFHIARNAQTIRWNSRERFLMRG